MTELWRLAAADRGSSRDSDHADDAAMRMLAAERDALVAEAKVLQTLNQELQRHRTTAEKSLAEARALLSRREAALEEERSRAASLDQTLVQARMELEVLLERRRLGEAPSPAVAKSRELPKRKRPARRPASSKRKKGAKRASSKQSVSRKAAKSTRRRAKPRNRRK
jgi:hypothetical protein